MQAGITVNDLSISMFLPSEEATLVAELQAGSERAFAELIERYHQPLYSLIARNLQDPIDAADITQEVFLKAYRGIGSFHGDASLRTWLYRIALREASNQRRWWIRHKLQETALDAPCCSINADDPRSNTQSIASTLPDGCRSPLERAEQRETRERVEAALCLIPEAFRRVVVLREIEGFSYEEISELLQVNLGTVKSRLMRGRAALRTLLSPALGIPSCPHTAVIPRSTECRVAHSVPKLSQAGFRSRAGRLRAHSDSLPEPILDQKIEVSR